MWLATARLYSNCTLQRGRFLYHTLFIIVSGNVQFRAQDAPKVLGGQAPGPTGEITVLPKLPGLI